MAKSTVARPVPNRMQLLMSNIGKFRPIKESRRVDSNAVGQPAGYPAEDYPDLPEAMAPAANWLDYAGGATVYAGGTSDWRAFGSGELPGRIPRLMYPNISHLAGLSSVDATRQTANWLFLPPMDPPQRGGQRRSVSGGANRASGGSGRAGSFHIPAAFVPLGWRS